ncbi:MAG: PAS domain S-box protein [Candidatus Cloacimonadota bacterium]|nr:PAS domain S-box protein [Candidatus Cloacimonadota bacterium]
MRVGVFVIKDNNSLNWKHVFNSIKDSIALLDTDGFIKECNEVFKKLVNKTNSQIIGSHCSKIIFGRTKKLKNCPFLRSKRSKKRESLTVDKDDRKFNVDVDPILDKNKITGFVLYISDITEHRKAEKVLEESEEKFRTLTENINVGLYRNTVGAKGKFIEANPAIVKMFGFKDKKEFLAYNVSELYLHSQERKRFNNGMLKRGFVKNEELQLKKVDGTKFLGSISAEAIKDENGNVQFYDGIVVDITERKKIEDALQKKENDLRTLFNAMTDIVLEIDYDGKYINIAPTMPDLLYRLSTEMLGKTLHEIFPPKEADKFLSAIQKSLDKVKIVSIEYPLEIRNKIIWFEARITPKTKNTILFIAHEITERRQAEEALRKSEKKYRDLFEKSKDALLIIHNGKFVDCNQATIKMLRYNSKNEFLNISPAELSPKKQPDGKMSFIKANEMMKIALKNGSHRFEWDHKKSDGEIFPVEVLLTAISSDEKNQIIHTVWRDITERKQAEQALKESEKRFKQLVENANDIIYQLDVKGYITYVNPVTLKMGSYTKKDLIGKKYLEIVHPDYYHEIKRFFRTQFTNKIKNTYKEFPVKTKSGSLVWLGQNVQLLFEKNKIIGYQAVARDITARKKSELALRESENRFKYLFEQSPVSIWEEDFSKVYEYLNALKKKGIENFKDYFEKHLDEVNKCSKMVSILEINEKTNELFKTKNKNELITNLGSIFTEESLSSFIEQLCAIAQNETRYKGECINKTLDGKIINVALEFNVVPGYEKDYSRVLISLIDITEQKRAGEEIRNSRERLKMLNKIIRHDIANDFIVIKSAINIYRRASDAKMIDEIERRVDKSLNTIDNYRKYESFIDLNQDLHELEIAEILNDIIAEFPKIKFNIQGNCKVFADNALDSVFTNLITNSIKHGNSTKIDVKISLEDNMCKINFIDNGTGIPDKIKGKIFDEGFFHGKAGHTGIGLHIIKQTIERYGGSISIEDNKPSGAVFIIELRRAL